MKTIEVVVLFSALCVPWQVLGQADDGGFQEVMTWLKANGATANADLRSNVFKLGGANVRGVLTPNYMPDKTTLWVIPKRLWLVPSHFPNFAESKLPSTCRRIKEHELKFAAALAAETQKGKSSFYYTYLKHLPTTTDFRSFLPRMMEAGLQSEFAALPLVAEVQQSQADDKDIKACFEKWVKEDGSPARGLTWEQIQLGLNWINTRAFTMFQYFGTQDINALIPGADMLNTATNVGLNVEWHASETEYTMQTGKPVASASELRDPYCQDCDNIKMMKHWGVYMEDNPNPVPNPVQQSDADICSGEGSNDMKQLTQAALQDPASAATGWLSPRCRASTLDKVQGPLRCSLARLAWETCSEHWEKGSTPNAALVEVRQLRFLSTGR